MKSQFPGEIYDNPFFVQKGLEGGTSREIRVNAVGVDGKFQLAGSPVFRYNLKGLTEATSRKDLVSLKIAELQARRAFRKLPANHPLKNGGVFGFDVQESAGKLGGGGVIEYNLSQHAQSGVQGGFSGSLDSLNTLIPAAKRLGQNIDPSINAFTARGQSILGLSGHEQSTAFKSFYKDLLKLESRDELAYLKTARNLTNLGFGLKVGRGAGRRQFQGASAGSYLTSRGFAEGFVPNYAPVALGAGEFGTFYDLQRRYKGLSLGKKQYKNHAGAFPEFDATEYIKSNIQEEYLASKVLEHLVGSVRIT